LQYFAEGAFGRRIGRKIDGTMNWRMFNAGAPVLAGFSKEAEFTF
jgi:protein-L-isoaspartate(D-aspartate) O-methyltransferase